MAKVRVRPANPRGKAMPKKPQASKTQRSTQVMRSGVPPLDLAAREYRDLIADPCNAKLVNSIWTGSNGSFVSRFETDFIIFNDATATAGILVFVPGTNQIYTNSSGILTNDTATATLGTGAQPGPGQTFLSGSAGNIRAVASCMQVSYPGTELTRSGIIGLGVTNFGTFAQNLSTANGGGNTTTTAAAVRTLCQHTERMPQSMGEVTWFPNTGDQIAFEQNSARPLTEQTTESSPKNCMILSVAGLPLATGVRVRIVNVVEWTPRTGQGMVATAEVPRSSNTINDILRSLPATKGTNWFINAYKKWSPTLGAIGSTISYGAKMLGPAMALL